MTDIAKRLRVRAETRNTGRKIAKSDAHSMGYYTGSDSLLDEQAALEIERLREIRTMLLADAKETAEEEGDKA